MGEEEETNKIRSGIRTDSPPLSYDNSWTTSYDDSWATSYDDGGRTSYDDAVGGRRTGSVFFERCWTRRHPRWKAGCWQEQKVKRQGMGPDDRWFNGNLNVNGRRGEDRWPRTADEGGHGVRPLERDRRLDPGRAAGGRGGQRCQRGHRRRCRRRR